MTLRTTKHATLCASVCEAKELEKKFHEIGWSARAVAFVETVGTVILTSN